MSSLVFHSVSFAYDTSVGGLFSRLRFGIAEGWTGVVGENGSGKSTLLRLACGELEPRQGSITAPDARVYCPQPTDEAMPETEAFLASDDGEAYAIRALAGVDASWAERWGTLSHGERKRLQLATCLWLRPDLLAVDEPTNHLDESARATVVRALRAYRGIGLVVSHDRALLDELCSHVLLVSPPCVTLRSGGYTTAVSAARAEQDFARREREAIRADRRRLEEEMAARRVHVQKRETAKSLRGAARCDHDAREKARAARDRDHGSGKSLRQLEGRIQQARAKEGALATPAPRSLGVRLHSRPSERPILVRVPAGGLALGSARQLAFPDLLIRSTDRIALTGPNGAGKSTLVRHLVSLASESVGAGRILYIPQEVPRDASARLLDDARRISGEALGRAMQWVHRLGSDPRRLLASRAPSPGEVRKLCLALRMADEPHLIVLDEPTNHMDLPSIECLESALSEQTCALVLVSHDRTFLEALVRDEWKIVPDEPYPARLSVVPQELRPPIADGASSV